MIVTRRLSTSDGASHVASRRTPTPGVGRVHDPPTRTQRSSAWRSGRPRATLASSGHCQQARARPQLPRSKSTHEAGKPRRPHILRFRRCECVCDPAPGVFDGNAAKSGVVAPAEPRVRRVHCDQVDERRRVTGPDHSHATMRLSGTLHTCHGDGLRWVNSSGDCWRRVTHCYRALRSRHDPETTDS